MRWVAFALYPSPLPSCIPERFTVLEANHLPYTGPQMAGSYSGLQHTSKNAEGVS